MVTGIAQPSVHKIGLLGVVSAGDGRSSFGDVNAYDVNGTLVLPWKNLIEKAFSLGRSVYVLEGEYPATNGAPTITGMYPHLDIAPAATIVCTGAQAVAGLSLSGCIGGRFRGGRYSVSQATNDQAIVKTASGFNNLIEGVEVTFTAAGSSSNPMFGILAVDETESNFDRCRVLPHTGVIGMRDQRGTGNVWDRPKTTNGLNQGAIDVVAGRDCYIGLDIYDCQFCQVRSMRAWGIGNPTTTQPVAILRVFGSGAEVEDGHCIIDSPQMEVCAPDAYILIEGSQGWVSINSCELGLSNFGIGTLGHAAIKVTRNAAESRNSTRIDINGGRIHNVGRSIATAQGLFALVRGTITAATAIDVTGTDTFHRAAGAWTVIPVAGEWIQTTLFANASNNGHFKVVSADANDITVDTTISGALTNESGSGNETLVGSYPFEGSAIWLEHCSEVNLNGVRIVDQRHQWGINIDTASVRGVTIDGNCVFHKGSGTGAIAPIRMPTETLPNVAAAVNDAEGVSLGLITLKTWGATPVVVSNGTVTPTLGTAAPTITVTNAPFFLGTLGNSAANYDGAASTTPTTISSNAISAANADNSLNGTNVFVGLAADDVVLVSGFTGSAAISANNGVATVVSNTGDDKLILAGVTITDDAAGDAIVITKLTNLSTLLAAAGGHSLIRRLS